MADKALTPRGPFKRVYHDNGDGIGLNACEDELAFAAEFPLPDDGVEARRLRLSVRIGSGGDCILGVHIAQCGVQTVLEYTRISSTSAAELLYGAARVKTVHVFEAL